MSSSSHKPRRAKKSPHSLKDFFIPHSGNNHAPHILHPKRAVLYGGVFIAAKAIVFFTILALPLQAYLLPDVLAEQERELNALISELRTANNLPTLAQNFQLENSSQAKAGDMAQNAYFSHMGPQNRDFKYFLKQADYAYTVAGENLAMGFVSPRDVMEAWIKSPLHNKNLMDGDFVEMGLGIDSGRYRGQDTVFIAHHFGQPLTYVSPLGALAPVVSKLAGPARDRSEVMGYRQTLTAQAAELQSADDFYDKTKSRVYWRANGNKTTLNAKAYFSGEVVTATVTVDAYTFALQPSNDTAGLYEGSVTVAKPVDDFFKVVVDPTLSVTFADEFSIVDTIPWYEVKIVNPTPLVLYFSAQSGLSKLLQPLFTAERALYVLGIAFFSLALLINILVEIKTQKPHIIIPAGLIIILLALLLAL